MIERNFVFEEYLDSDFIDSFCTRAYFLHDVEVNQKYDDKPYSYHLKSVVEFAKKYVHLVAKDFSHVEAIIFGAAFHDSIEDARLTYNDLLKIAKEYMSDDNALIATEIVYALTNEKGRNRQERANDSYYYGIRNTMYAPFVKMCDRLANYTYSKENGSSMAKKYEEEMTHFLDNIKNVDAPEERNVPEEMINLISQKH